MFHVFDGNNWSRYSDLSAATRAAEDAIDTARDACDPHWPDWVNHIAVYAAAADSSHPDEEGKELLTSQECSYHEAPSDSGCDYYCEYKIDTPIP